jgi:hypothetical protein
MNVIIIQATKERSHPVVCSIPGVGLYELPCTIPGRLGIMEIDCRDGS